MTTSAIEPFAAPLHRIDWDDIEAVEDVAGPVLAALAGAPRALGSALRDVPNRPELLNLCEHYDILDQIVLYDRDGVRLRLHVFLPGHFDRPHNHRLPYAARILKGGYRHTLYGDIELDPDIDARKLKPIQVRQEGVGASYALGPSGVHAVVARAWTVTLVAQGPAKADRFLVSDRDTGMVWWQYGADQESPEEAARKRMLPDRLDDLTTRLHEWGVV